ncbi:MAG: TlpA family protein disulfide reductase [Nitrosopumilus sp.]|nr:TlpA family protein disulfide reductase [Nitrosopumilus sp.]
MKRIKYFLLALLCPYFIIAQDLKTFPAYPLSIGDSLPEFEFINLVNTQHTNIRLADLNDKLIILDFWATWCTSCLKGFEKLRILEQEFKNELQVILVNASSTTDDINKINEWLVKYQQRYGQAINFPILAEDTTLAAWFPHIAVPHYVWLYKGKVKAISSADALNAANIQEILMNGSPSITTKADQDLSKPLFSSALLPVDSMLFYSVLLKGSIDNVAAVSMPREVNGVVNGFIVTHKPLITIYITVVRKLYPGFPTNRIIINDDENCINSEDSLLLKQNFSFDIIVPLNKSPGLYNYALNSLNAYSGFTGRFEKRSVKCWVLCTNQNDKKGSKKPLSKKPTEKTLSSQDLVNRINRLSFIKAPVVNEIDISKIIPPGILNEINSIEELKTVVRNNGIDMIEETQNLEMFVLSKN